MSALFSFPTSVHILCTWLAKLSTTHHGVLKFKYCQFDVAQCSMFMRHQVAAAGGGRG